MSALPDPPLSIEAERPIVFGPSEEVAVAIVTGQALASFPAGLLGAFVGGIGAKLGEDWFEWPIVGGSLFVWVLCWGLPLVWTAKKRPVWQTLLACLAGVGYLASAQLLIHKRDLGAFYPWALTALPFGIVLGTVYEPIRLATGGSTKEYNELGASVGSGFVFYGKRYSMYRAIGAVLALVATLVCMGRQRFATPLAGLLAGGLAAALPSAIVSWFGDVATREVFFGSLLNVIWIGVAIGALTGCVVGYCVWAIREKQEQLHQRILAGAASPPATSQGIRES